MINNGTWHQSNGAFAAGTGSFYLGGTFTLGGGTFTAAGGYIDVNSTFTLSGGTFTASTGTMYLSGDMSLASGVWNRGSGSVVFDGDLTLTDTILANLGTVFIGSSPDTVTLANDATMDVLTIDEGDMLVTAGYDIDLTGSITVNGTLDATGASDDGTTMEVGGNWTTSSTGTVWFGSTSTITFDGTSDQTVAAYSGSFQNITVTNSGSVTFSEAFIANGDFTNTTAGSTMLFANNVTFTIAGTLTLTGASGQEITLNSTDNTNRFTFDVTGGTQTVTFVNVSNAAADSNDIHAYASTNSTNNDDSEASPHWVFQAGTSIFRSVGPAATSALDTGSGDSNQLTISGSTATFSIAVPDNVGVGDALIYDSDGDGTVDAIAFISGRTSSTEYTVQSTSGEAPTETTVVNDTDWAIYRAYTSLANAENGIENTGIAAFVGTASGSLANFDDWTAGGDATTSDAGRDIASNNEQWNIACYANGTTADSTIVNINGWTPSATNYIRIFTPVAENEVGVNQRHTGRYDTSKYRLEITAGSNSTILSLSEDYVRVEGLQLIGSTSGSYTINMITLQANNIQISGNIITKGTDGGTSDFTGISYNTSSSYNAYIKNNIIYSLNSAIYQYSGDGYTKNIYFYNNTIVNCTRGIWGNSSAGGSTTYYAKNNIVKGSGDTNAYIGTFADSDYNATDGTDATDGGANSYQSVSIVFEDESNNDYHLASGDTAARGKGTDLYADTDLAVTDDIDGQARPASGAFDIGADQASTAIFRSVGPGATDDLNTTPRTVEITGTTATFSGAMPSNVGIGDVLQYTSGSVTVAFITGRTSDTVFTVKKADGSDPTAAGAATPVSVFRAYTSLANAETGTENASLDDTVEDFDTWSGGKDIFTSNEQWNIVCYANGTTADSTAVTIDGWTTRSSNYLKIYTPSSAAEVGTTQRHSGKWDDTKYKLVASAVSMLNLNEGYLRIEGLQLETTRNADGASCINVNEIGDTRIQSNIMRIRNADDFGRYAIVAVDDADFNSDNGVIRVINNIVTEIGGTDWTAGMSFQTYIAGNDPYTAIVYNNTISNVDQVGIRFRGDALTYVARNNLLVNNGTDYAIDDITPGNGTTSTNITSDATSPDGAGYQNKNITFEDGANYDFHLASGDTAARNTGTDLSADTSFAFATDVDGHSRPAGSAWDIGADEGATAIFRSVGPGATDDLNTAPQTVEISGTTATFSGAMPNNIGVGDVLQYTSGSVTVAFITGRTSDTVFTVKKADGSDPTAVGAATPVSVYRAYTSLHNAESGTENESLDDTVEDFDTWSGGKDIFTSNEQWNIACYANGSTADTTAVNIGGWTTTLPNYIKVYTPTLSSEVGTSQRHQGKLTTNAYLLDYTGTNYVLAMTVTNVTIDGLQFDYDSGANRVAVSILPTGVININLLNNIIHEKNADVNTGNNAITKYTQPTGGALKIYNNIIYGFNDADDICIRDNVDSDAETLIYNNTLYDCTTGISGLSTTILKNNIIQNSSDGFTGVFGAASDHNLSDVLGDAPNATFAYGTATVTFLNESDNDFRLAYTDTAAHDLGTDLSADPYFAFSTDIQSQTRPGGSAWDIGADEIVNVTWDNGSADGLWSTPANWTTDAVPAGSDNAMFDTTSLSDCTIDTTAMPGSITIGAGYTGTITQSGSYAVVINNGTWHQSNGTFAAGSGSLYLGGTLNLGGGTFTAAGGYIDVNSTFTLSGGAFTASTGTMYLSGDMDLASGVFNKGNGSVVFDGDLTLTDTILANLGNVFVATDTVTLANDVTMDVLTIDEVNTFVTTGYDIDLTGSITVNGTLDATGASDDGTTMEVGGNWTTSSTGTVWFGTTSTVTFDGTLPQTVAANSGSFQNVTVTNSSTVTFSEAFTTLGNFTNETAQSSMLFANNTTFTIAGTLTLTGLKDNEITLNSTDDTNRFTFNVTAGAQTVTFVNVSNAAADSNDIHANDSIEGTNTDSSEASPHWVIIAVQKTIYRSVGPSATGALDTGSADTNQLTINGTTATFTIAVPDHVGVGDAIIYDADNDGTVDAIAFISGRTDSGTFTVKATDGEEPTETTAADVDWRIYRAYTSLSNAESGIENSGISTFVGTTSGALANFDDWTAGGDATADDAGRDLAANDEQWNIACYANGTTADSAIVNITGWNTSAMNYLRIYTPYQESQVGERQRHYGVWDNTMYNLSTVATADGNNSIRIGAQFVRIEGLQISNTNSGYQYCNGISVNGISANNVFYISKNIIKGTITTNISFGFCTYDADFEVLYFWDNIVYGFDHTDSAGVRTGYSAGGSNDGYFYIFNNTVHSNYYGFLGDGGSAILKNNLAAASTSADYSSSGWFNGSSNNVSSDDTADDDADMLNSVINASVDFTDAANYDLHLAFADTAARGAGSNLYADADLAVTTDIDGHARPSTGAFDAGADQAAKHVFYAVGQNTDDHSSGGNVSITDGLATFTVPQTATNMGVGDVLVAGSNSYYISGKQDTSNWNVVTETGATPSDLAETAVTSISHAFDSLSAAEANASTLLGTTDLFTNNYVLNIPCYYDSGVDTEAVRVDNWTTAVSNYIKIYAPNNIYNEVNRSQRHNGVPGSGYKLLYNQVISPTLYVDSVQYTRIVGIEAEHTGTQSGIRTYYADFSIIDGCIGKSSAGTGISVATSSMNNYTTVMNSIAYDSVTGFGVAGTNGNRPDRFYNNTSVDNTTGFSGGSLGTAATILKNNVAYNNTTNYSANLTSAENTSNASDASDPADIPGDNSITGISYTDFVNYAADNFHLSASSSLVNGGTDLSGTFNNDLDGQTRSGLWDIGADEIINVVWDNSSTDGLWSTATNWSTDVVPSGSDNAMFDTTSLTDCTIDTTAMPGSITIGAEYTGTITQSSNYAVVITNGTWHQSNGIYAAGSGSFYLGGTFTLGGGTFTAAGGYIDVNSTFTLSGGTFTVSTGTIYLSGDMSLASGVFNKGSGSIVFDGDLTLTDTILANLGTVIIGSSPDTVNLGNDVTMDVLTIDDGDMLATNGYDIDISGSLTVYGTLDVTDDAETDTTNVNIGGSLNMMAGSSFFDTDADSTVIFDGTNVTVDLVTEEEGHVLSNLELNGTTLTVELEDALTVAGNVTIAAGNTLDAKSDENNILIVGGNWNNAGTFAHQSGTVSMTPTGSATLAAGSTGFHDLTVDSLKTGLIAWWKMNDNVSGDAQTIADSSGASNNGTTVDGANNTGMDCTINGKFSKGCQFDGADDYITIPFLNIYGTSFDQSNTVAAWFKANTASDDMRIFYARENTNADEDLYDLSLSPTGLVQTRIRTERFTGDGDTVTVQTASEYDDNQWHHAAVTFNDYTVSLYVDGTFVDSNTIGAYSSEINVNYIGMEEHDDHSMINPFNGLIDDVRVYNRALSDKEILLLASSNPPTGLGKVTLTEDIDAAGDITIGVTTLETAGYDIDLAGSISINGTLDATGAADDGTTMEVGWNWTTSSAGTVWFGSSSTVTFDGSSTTLAIIAANSGSFQNITVTSSNTVSFTEAFTVNGDFINTTAGSTLLFANNVTFTIAGALTLTGISGDEIILDSTDGTNRFTLDVTDGAQTVTYVNVSNAAADSNNIRAYWSIDGGGNDNFETSPYWVFPEDDGAFWFGFHF